jgi:Mg2+/Co2+ transporter CorB
MEFIPEAGTSLKISGNPIEIMQVKNNMVKTARISLSHSDDTTIDISDRQVDGEK